MPDSYKRRFVFRGKSGILRIYRGGMRLLKIEQSGEIDDPEESSRALDWIHESVERIRYEVET
jgi:hypothetical protein